MHNDVVNHSWHIAAWPWLAWLETGIKSVALLIGVGALLVAAGDGGWAWPQGGRLVQTIILIALSLGLVAAIYDRLLEREIVAMGFVLFNNLGHWGMVAALHLSADLGLSLLLFAGLMLSGDLVKLIFLKRHNFNVRDVPQPVLFGLTWSYAGGYALILLLELF